MEYIFELHKTMLSRNLILVYEGEFTQEVTKSVLAMAERNMDSFGEQSSIKRKVFNVMVESLQNIVKHSDDVKDSSDKILHSAVFMIGKSDTDYIITTGNPVRNEKVSIIQDKLQNINDLDKDGLKVLYREIITNAEISDKGGAGLGFVDMARKSGNKLEFHFKPINEEYSFFSLKTSISRS